jgi:hypothetical protein
MGTAVGCRFNGYRPTQLTAYGLSAVLRPQNRPNCGHLRLLPFWAPSTAAFRPMRPKRAEQTSEKRPWKEPVRSEASADCEFPGERRVNDHVGLLDGSIHLSCPSAARTGCSKRLACAAGEGLSFSMFVVTPMPPLSASSLIRRANAGRGDMMIQACATSLLLPRCRHRRKSAWAN